MKRQVVKVFMFFILTGYRALADFMFLPLPSFSCWDDQAINIVTKSAVVIGFKPSKENENRANKLGVSYQDVHMYAFKKYLNSQYLDSFYYSKKEDFIELKLVANGSIRSKGFKSIIYNIVTNKISGEVIKVDPVKHQKSIIRKSQALCNISYFEDYEEDDKRIQFNLTWDF